MCLPKGCSELHFIPILYIADVRINLYCRFAVNKETLQDYSHLLLTCLGTDAVVGLRMEDDPLHISAIQRASAPARRTRYTVL